MSTDYTIVDGWESLSAAEAIKAVVDRHGKDGTTSVARCTLEPGSIVAPNTGFGWTCF
ncbi:hypothetical protein [Rhizobium rhizogenes]